MTIPDFQTCMRPALAVLAARGLLRSRDVKDALADVFALTDDERAQLLPSGRQRVMDNRVGWALTYLAQAELVRRPRRGMVEITDEGRRVLTANPQRVDMKTLEAFPAYLVFRERTREVTAPAVPALPEAAEQPATPEELISAAVQENRATLEHEVLDRPLSCRRSSSRAC